MPPISTYEELSKCRTRIPGFPGKSVPNFCCRVKQLYKYENESINEIVKICKEKYRKDIQNQTLDRNIITENDIDKSFIMRSLTGARSCPGSLFFNKIKLNNPYPGSLSNSV